MPDAWWVYFMTHYAHEKLSGWTVRWVKPNAPQGHNNIIQITRNFSYLKMKTFNKAQKCIVLISNFWINKTFKWILHLQVSCTTWNTGPHKLIDLIWFNVIFDNITLAAICSSQFYCGGDQVIPGVNHAHLVHFPNHV